MTNLTPIIHRAERCTHQYPKQRFILAHKALAGDMEADREWALEILTAWRRA